MYGIHKNTSCDWLRIKIALSPSVTTLSAKSWREKKCCSSFPCSARPNSPLLGKRIHAVDWCGEYYNVCWRTMRVLVYMTWHRQRGMGHMSAPQDVPAAGVTWYTAMAYLGGVRGKRRGGERDRGDMFLVKIVELKFIEISGVVVQTAI